MADAILQRRGFLRGLASLPLIGGSVALVGQPSAAAVPVTTVLQERYIAWLANEHAAALMEFDRPEQEVSGLAPTSWAFHRVRTPIFWFPEARDVELSVLATRPSTRAAVVLSAAGVPLI